MKYIHNLWVKIIVSIGVGFLFAGASTTVTYSCIPEAPDQGCVSFEKAIMHPADLLTNKQNSLLHFSMAFVIVSLLSFALASIYSWTQKKKSRPAGH